MWTEGMSITRREFIRATSSAALLAGVPAAWAGVITSSPSSLPNVLLIVVDTLRADRVSSYGYQRSTTPTMDSLAQEGVLFENAYATSPWTPPSHASLLTGRPVSEHAADGLRPVLGKQYPTLPEVLASQGYATAGFAANTLWVTRNSGLARGFHHFEDYFHSPADMAARTVYGKEIARRILRPLGYRDILGRKRAGDVNQAFLRWLDANPDRPFFALLNYFDVHSPYISPAPYHTRFMDPKQRATEGQFPFIVPALYDGTADTVALLTAGYDGTVAFVDSELSRLVAALRLRGLLDKTLVILTSDHGEAFGEHGLFEHGHSLYRELLHVPLILRCPEKMPQGIRISAPVSLQDIPATLMSLALPGVPPHFPGNSLHRLWSTRDSSTDSVARPILSEVVARKWLPRGLPISQGWLKSLVISRWHLIFHEGGSVELYDLQKDPTESRNLAQTPDGQRVVQDLRYQLQDMLRDRDSRTRTDG